MKFAIFSDIQRVLKFDREKFVKTLNECTYPEKSIISKVFFGVN